MAEEEKPEATEEQEEPQGKKWLWATIATIILIVGGAALYFFVVLPGEAETEVAAATKAPQTLTDRVKSIMKLDAFLINLADPEGSRFLKVTLHLGFDQSKVGEELAANPVVLAAIRDRINSILSTKTSEQVLSPEGKETLRREIRDIVNSLLPAGKVVDVYILDFIVQL